MRGGPRPTPSPLAPRGWLTLGTGAFGPELKYNDVTQSNLTLSHVGGTPVNVTLNGIAQGDDNNSRDGRQIHMVSCTVRFWITHGQSPNPASPVRVALIWDSANNASTGANQSDVYKDVSSCSSLNLDNRNRFKVLRDELIEFDRYDTTGGPDKGVGWGRTHAVRNWFVRFPKGTVTTYTGTAGSTAAIESGRLFIMAWTQNGTVYVIDFFSRVRFHE